MSKTAYGLPPMENEKCICLLRKLIVSIRELESDLLESSGCDLNQAMLLCVLSDNSLSASEIAAQIGILPAQNSKLLSAAEDKGWVERHLGHDDKRKIYFNLTDEGKQQLKMFKALQLNVPDFIRPLFDSVSNKTDSH